MAAVLVAACNGEAYLPAQLDSLLAQTGTGCTIHIRDDCSSDRTWEIVRRYQARHPELIRAGRNRRNSGGAARNFTGMMIDIKDEYVMLCDQDDIWLPGKVAKSIAKVQAMEAEYGKDTPLLVHTDLRVVDENLRVIAPSFRAMMKAGYERTELRHFLIQNMLSGCTVAYNRALANLITVEPEYMIMHDWWLGLVASAFGKIGCLDEQTVLYRQHGRNEIGARDVRSISYKLHKLTHGAEVRKSLAQTYAQAASFLRLYAPLLTDSQKALLSAYIQIPTHTKIGRFIMINRLGVLKYGLLRKIANFLFI
jgi:glycosyltransferase involved in cell wall biosynthesis